MNKREMRERIDDLERYIANNKGPQMQNHVTQYQPNLPVHNPGYFAPKAEALVATDLITDGGKLYRKFEGDGFQSWKLEPVTQAKPATHWRGKPISSEVWQEICAFFEWGQTTYRSEQVVRLFYNQTIEQWKAWAFPQEISGGLSVKEVETDPRWQAQREGIGRGFELYGSVHHHCTAGAFQSGGDRTDEREHSGRGVHFTVGHIGSSHYDLHGRVILLDGIQNEINLEEWFEVPLALRQAVAPSLAGALAPMALAIACTPPPAGTTFPEEWKTNLVHRTLEVSRSVTTYPLGGTYHTSYKNTASDYAHSLKISYQEKKDLVDAATILAAEFGMDFFDMMMILMRENYTHLPITWCNVGDSFIASKKRMGSALPEEPNPSHPGGNGRLLEEGGTELEGSEWGRLMD